MNGTFKGINFCGYELSRFRDFYLRNRILVPLAKVSTCEIILMTALEVTREILIKIQKNGQNLHENQKIQSKFPSIAKVDTRES